SNGLTDVSDVLGELVVSTDQKATTDEEPASGNVKLTVGDLSTSIPVTVGTESTEVLHFSDPSAFTDGADRATGSFAAGEPTPEGQPSIELDYDFSTSSATRGYYLIPKEPVEPDGHTLAHEKKGR